MLNLVLYFYFIVLAFSFEQWYQIPHDDEEVFVNYKKEVSSFDEAKRACRKRNAINLILYKKNVLDFMTTFIIPEFCLAESKHPEFVT